MVKAVGYAYDTKTNDWTERVEYQARDREEAKNWIRMNQDWFKRLHIEQ